MTKKGYKVVAFDRYNSNDHGWLNNSPYKKDFEFILGDIRDYDSVNKASKGCSGVMHLAALIGIPYSYFSPIAYVKTNIEGTYNLLEASKNNKIDNIIITSTSEVYGTPKKMPINENNQINSRSPYAASKVAADQLALEIISGLLIYRVKIIRPFNTWPKTIKSSNNTNYSVVFKSQKQKFIFAGNLLPTRDLNYVDDVVMLFLKFIKLKKQLEK